MSKAYVCGVPCTVYKYEMNINNLMIIWVKYNEFDYLMPVIADLVEVEL